MANGIDISLPVSFGDPTLPRIPPIISDPLLTTGSIALYEPAHPSFQWPTGVPANGALLPNLAYDQLYAQIGTGSADDYRALWSDNHGAADALFQRTGKGSLHGIYSQVNNTSANTGAVLSLPLPLQTYLYNNPTHAYYISLWGRITRIAQTSTSPRISSIHRVSSPGAFLAVLDRTGSLPTIATNRLTNPANTVGEFLWNIDVNTWTTSAPISAADVLAAPVGFGPWGPGSAAWVNAAPSIIFRRFYIEDLTVSGRSYATVDGLETANYAAQVTNSSGRYFGDTFTDPATFP